MSRIPNVASAACTNHNNIVRNRSNSRQISRPPRRGRANTRSWNQTHAFRKTNATPTYKSRNSGSRVEVRIRTWCICRYVVSIANRNR